MIRFATGLAMAALLDDRRVLAEGARPPTPASPPRRPTPNMPPFKIDFEIKDVMDHVIDYNADSMWEKQGWDIDAKGEHPLFPTTEAEWTETANHAATLAEAGPAADAAGPRRRQ